MSDSVLNCTRCNGAGQVKNWRGDGTMISCDCCYGRGFFERPDLVQLSAAIKGRKPSTLRCKRPNDPRAWYLWRMVRFHSGKDVTLPMTASLSIHGDPFMPMLDQAAKLIAKHLTGRESIGSARWRHAMYGEPADSAILSMPTFDKDKPAVEALETF